MSDSQKQSKNPFFNYITIITSNIHTPMETCKTLSNKKIKSFESILYN